ncbi:uncharacterized protein LOC116199226 isoform X2 [Punica granatum]|uniref:Uncharacterized protein LOC116199226 isoform X2 n=1 Tax=Punica granatum TaxID=22663 RepID=A0A6P8D1F9_PUNGR|nr:uncharacterized protein LOC116199226 isoform X2 [Punica granatum]
MQNTPTFRGGRVIWVGSILPMTSCRVDDSSANDSRAVCLPELKPQARVLLSLLSSPPLVLAAVAVDTEVDREGEMLRLNRLVQRSCSSTRASILTSHLSVYEEEKLTPLPSRHSAQRTSNRFLDIHQLFNKEAIEKERARLKDEMNRGYFADISEFKLHGGKVAAANKIIIPAMAAKKFPDIEVTRYDRGSFKLPISCKGNMADANTPTVPKVSLVCLSFRANSQPMVDSWTVPFANAFNDPENVHLYEVSLIDQWLLCLRPIKWLLLRVVRKTKHDGGKDALERQIVYSFGDHYYFRKELKILNLLTAIRWQGFGFASKEELSSLLSCASLLLKEQ